MTSVTEFPRPEDALRQGDILRTPRRADGAKLGVIINADCDLAHGKTDGVIAWLPIFSFRAFVENFWAIDFARSHRNTLTKKVLELIDCKPEEASAILSWLAEAPAESVADTRRQFVSNVYLGASRAENTLRICTSEERGGPADLLKLPLLRGNLVELVAR